MGPPISISLDADLTYKSMLLLLKTEILKS